VAAQQGTPTPEGVIFDRTGRTTTDPEEFFKGGLMAPLGYPLVPHKGFGLALFVDALAGALSGAALAQGVATDAPGNFLWALDVEAFLPRQSSCSVWTRSSTRSSRANGVQASTSWLCPANVAGADTWS
jgi:LDH2 family malate/lactate/ureidoglycolate dehydrogenase